jgi:hypothetical protein
MGRDAKMNATYVSATSFTVVGDQTTIFVAGRRVKCNCGVDGYDYGTILSSAYTTLTTITLTAASDDLTANLTSVEWSAIIPNSIPNKMTLDFDWNDKILQKPELKDYSETKTAPSSSSVLTLDIVNGNVFSTLLTENVTTLNFNNPSPSGKACSFTWIMTQHSSAVTIAWPASVKWDSGTAPTISENDAIYIFTFVTVDAGTTWYGFLAGSKMAVPA